MTNHAIEDEVCISNFQCTEKFEEGPVCKVFYKSEEDLDCHIPCLISNCSYEYVRHPVCEVWHCMGNLGPATIVENHFTLIIGLSAFAIGFLICMVGVVPLWCRWRRRLVALEERSRLLNPEDEIEADVPRSIIRGQLPGPGCSVAMRPLSLSEGIVTSSGSPPPPAYDDATRQTRAASSSAASIVASLNPDQPINSYQESLACLETAYRKVRAKTPKESFRMAETMETIITCLISASEAEHHRHDLMNPLCQCYECFLINLEQTISDNEREQHC